MKYGRNDPCPCGSGKKYKKCCCLTDKNGDAEDNIESPDTQDDDDFSDYGEILISAINNLRRYFLNKEPHIKEYNKIRKIHGEIVDAMVKYHEDGKFELELSNDALPQAKQEKTLVFLETHFNLETRAGAQGFYDMLIYKTIPNKNCITEAFIRNHRYKKPEKIEFLHSMLDSTLGLFEATGIDTDEGYVYIKEVFTGAQYTLIDVGWSGDKNYADYYNYTRIITYHGISFGTGLNLIFSKTDSFIIDHIQQHRIDYKTNGEFLRFIKLYNQYTRYPDKVKVIENTYK